MIQKLCCALLALVLLASVCAFAETTTYDVVYTSENPIPDIYDRVSPAIVRIYNYEESWDATTRISSTEVQSGGSGSYIIADEDGIGGYILTNNHVVEDADALKICWPDGTEMDADLVGTDDGTDIAVLHFDDAVPEGTEVIPMGDSDALRVGELAICIGNHGITEDDGDIGFLVNTVTAGVISGLAREGINADNFSRGISVIQTDAAVNEGVSGGAMLNAKGELVGIPTLKYMFSGSGTYEGLGFCIPINTVRDFIDQIIDTGKVVRPRVGMTISDNDGPDEPMHKYPPIGALVSTVEAGGPSDKAGIKEKDIIMYVNDVRVEGYRDVLTQLDKCAEGDSVKFTICRYKYDDEGELTGDYEIMDVDVTLAIID